MNSYSYSLIFNYFYSFAHQSELTDKLIVFFAVYFPYLVIILAGLFLLFHHDVFKVEYPYQIFFKKKKEIFAVFATSGVAWVVASLLKILIHIPRPGVGSLVSETGYAFPSGHATFFMALAISIYLLHKKAGYWFIACAFIIGLARIMAGVHFPSDILGGFGLGALVAYLVKVYRMR